MSFQDEDRSCRFKLSSARSKLYLRADRGNHRMRPTATWLCARLQFGHFRTYILGLTSALNSKLTDGCKKRQHPLNRRLNCDEFRSDKS